MDWTLAIYFCLRLKQPSRVPFECLFHKYLLCVLYKTLRTQWDRNLLPQLYNVQKNIITFLLNREDQDSLGEDPLSSLFVQFAPREHPRPVQTPPRPVSVLSRHPKLTNLVLRLLLEKQSPPHTLCHQPTAIHWVHCGSLLKKGGVQIYPLQRSKIMGGSLGTRIVSSLSRYTVREYKYTPKRASDAAYIFSQSSWTVVKKDSDPWKVHGEVLRDTTSVLGARR